MAEEVKDDEAVPEGTEASESPSGGLRQLFAKKQAIFAMGGAVLAIGLGVALMAWPGDPPAEEKAPPKKEPDPKEVQKPMTAKPRPRKLVVGEEAKSVFARAEDALAEGNPEQAREILELGLSKTPVGEAGLRSQFFQRLAQVASHVGRIEAARIYEKSGKRLEKVEEEARALLEEGFAALAAGDPASARQRLYQFILRAEDVKEGGALLKGLAWRTITRAWFEEFTAAGGLKKAELAEPEFGFERRGR